MYLEMNIDLENVTLEEFQGFPEIFVTNMNELEDELNEAHNDHLLPGMMVRVNVGNDQENVRIITIQRGFREDGIIRPMEQFILDPANQPPPPPSAPVNVIPNTGGVRKSRKSRKKSKSKKKSGKTRRKRKH
tara:strand:+ start:2343 stop:2738 length:396 start_codon:yes stop_codon:yes gene_type:complete